MVLKHTVLLACLPFLPKYSVSIWQSKEADREDWARRTKKKKQKTEDVQQTGRREDGRWQNSVYFLVFWPWRSQELRFKIPAQAQTTHFMMIYDKIGASSTLMHVSICITILSTFCLFLDANCIKEKARCSVYLCSVVEQWIPQKIKNHFNPVPCPLKSWNNPGSHLCTARNAALEGQCVHLASFTANVEECATVTRASSLFEAAFSLVSEVRGAHSVSPSTRSSQSWISKLDGFLEF